MMDLTGERYNKWTVISFHSLYKNKISKWVCKCDCGNEAVVLRNALRNGASKSCGCDRKKTLIKMLTKHGQSKKGEMTAEYTAWKCLKARCLNSKLKTFPYYGGRGVKVFVGWLGENGFETFFEYMGKRPSPEHSVDRWPDKNGNYEPGNVRWATKIQQSGNTRRNREIEYNGETKILQDWARKLGTKYQSIQRKIKKGQSFEQIYNFYKNNIVNENQTSL
jgi:hypothetical protein